MKKQLVIGIFLTLMFAAISITPTPIAHTEDDPHIVTLYAGQDIPVGTVSVWNDEENIHVVYETTDPWVITKTQLYVGKTDLTLLTSAPGQFPYPQDFDPAVDNYPYIIALNAIDSYHLKLDKNGNPTGKWEADGTPGVTSSDSVYIAAHAVVVSPIEGCLETVWQIGDIEGYDGTGHLTNYCDEFNYAGFYEGGPWESDPFANPFIVGTTPTFQFPWISLVVPPLGPYATDFNVQWSGKLVFGGKLTVSWSPGASAKETKIITSIDDGVPYTFVVWGSTDPTGWRHYPLVQSEVELDAVAGGSHVVRFQHTTGDGAIWDWVKLEKQCEQWETAWGNGLQFPGPNWAMYFTYNIQGWELVETLSVPAGGTHITSGLLDCGEYKFVASGTCNWRIPGSPGGYIADAEYWLRHDAYGEGWTHMGIWSLAMWNGAPVEVEWGLLYETTHQYSYVSSMCGPVTFFFNDDVYSDNSGSLTVQIYEWA